MPFVIKLEEVEAMIIWNALMEKPGKEVYPAIKTLDRQLTAQGAFVEAASLPANSEQSSKLG